MVVPQIGGFRGQSAHDAQMEAYDLGSEPILRCSTSSSWQQR